MLGQLRGDARSKRQLSFAQLDSRGRLSLRNLR
jgi:hypothetical protein